MRVDPFLRRAQCGTAVLQETSEVHTGTET